MLMCRPASDVQGPGGVECASMYLAVDAAAQGSEALADEPELLKVQRVQLLRKLTCN